MIQAKQPNITEALQEFDAGYLVSKLSKAAADVALGVVNHNKKGKVTLTLDLDRIGETHQVTVSHKINYVKPTLRGKASEEDTTSTPMYINLLGHMSVAPEKQIDLFKNTTENA